MCGIAGVVKHAPDAPVARAAIVRMLQTLVHRGPDGEGVFVAPAIGLGTRRLAIVDLAHGDQPLGNEDGSVVVVCNGEIYDAPETRARLQRAGHVLRGTSDVEVIPHLYEQHGLDFVKHLRGMFALALWDTRRRRLVLARDRLGIKPLCFHEASDGIWFASEVKAILAASDAIARRIEPEALRDLLTFGFVQTPRTLFAGIQRLPAGHLLVHENGRARLQRYWDVGFAARSDAPPRRSDDDWIAALRDKLTEAVRIHMRSDVPVGVLLSGGIDSSAVASLMCRLGGGGPLPSYSAGFDVDAADEPRHRRMLYDFPGFALEPHLTTARASDLAWLPAAIWSVEDPSASASWLWRARLASVAARDVKVVLTGEGADEALGGYPWYHGQKLLAPLARLPLAVRKAMLLGSLVPRHRPGVARLLLAPAAMGRARFQAMLSARSWHEGSSLLAPELVASLERAPGGGDRDGDGIAGDRALPAAFAGWHSFDQLQYFDLKVRLADYINHGLDRATMAFSVEARLPFLDHELIELCCSIPRHLRMRWLHEKYVLRRAMRGVVPGEILARAKRGTSSPIASWLRAGVLPDAVADALSPECLAATGYFAPRAVTALLDAHRAGRVDRAHDLLAVAGVQIWHQLYVAGAGAPERPSFDEAASGV